MFLVFDTETTGVPLSYNTPISDVNNWPRCVQLAWQLHDFSGKLIEIKNYIIYPEGFTIPEDVVKIHRINTERAKKEGHSLSFVLQEFSLALDKCKYIIGHNVLFDVKVVFSEYFRENKIYEIKKFQNRTLSIKKNKSEWLALDTCNEESAQHCKLPGGWNGGFKFPKLVELYNYLFGSLFDGAHDASVDVAATARCFLELLRLNVINVDQIFSKEEKVFFFKSNTAIISPFKPIPNIISKQNNVDPSELRIKNIKDFIEHKNLTSSQEMACSKLEDFVNSEVKKIFLLRGYAGTGKTTLLNALTKYLKFKGLSYSLLAPTGRAAKILRDKTGSGATIHSHIYNLNEVKEYKDNSIVQETFKFYFDIDVRGTNKFLIIDEASMISNNYSETEFLRFGSGYLLNDLIKFSSVGDHNKKQKIIFVGDNAQLPPVEMNYSPALTENFFLENKLSFDKIEMTDVTRQSLESGILKNATKIRKAISEKSFFDFKINYSLDVIKLNKEDVVDTYFNITNKTVSDDSIIIAQSNSLVKDYNLSIREKYFPNCDKIHTGDLLQVVKNNYSNEFNLMNGDFVKVSSVGARERRVGIYNRGKEKGGVINVPLNFIDVDILFLDKNGVYNKMSVKLLEDLLYSNERDLKEDISKALYVDFKNRNPRLSPKSKIFKDILRNDKYFNALRAKFGYAITCHKSQGGEWKNVVVDFQSSMGIRSESFFRWAYTASTRASTSLWCVNPPDTSSFDKLKIEDIVISEKKVMLKTSSNIQYVSRFHDEGAPMYLKEKFNLVQFQINGFCNIFSVKSLNWRERYVFEKNNNFIEVDFIYNKKGLFISPEIRMLPQNSFNESDLNELSIKLSNSVNNIDNEYSYVPSNMLFKKLYKIISSILSENIIIQVDEYPKDFFVRYFLKSDCEESYIQVYFKSNGQISYIKPVCSSMNNLFDKMIERLKEKV